MKVKYSSKRKWMRRTALTAGLLVTYPLILLGIEYSASKLLFPKIKTESELQQVIDKRKEKLGIKENIEGVLFSETTGMQGIASSGEEVICVGGDLATQIAIDHELYHRYKRDMDLSQKLTIKEKIKNIYIEEPRARIYSLLGIKL
jgi:hypothetical protein